MKSFNRFVVVLVVALAVLTPLQPNNAKEIVVNCFVFYYSECPSCMTKYDIYVQPFYNKYRNNGSIKFFMVDSAVDPSLFWETVYVLELNISELEGFPWVVFQYETQLVVHDERNLDTIELSFISILENSGYRPIIGEDTEEIVVIFGINIEILVIAVVLVSAAIIIVCIPTVYSNYRSDSRYKIALRRIETKRFVAIGGISVISLMSLVYQFLDYLQGGCGCSEDNLVKQLLFRKYDHVTFLGIDIPFSMIGIILMSSVVIITTLLASIPIPKRIVKIREKEITFDLKWARQTYYLLSLILLLALMSLFYLLYLEVVVIKFICMFCTISQIAIVVDASLIFSWKPFNRQIGHVD